MDPNQTVAVAAEVTFQQMEDETVLLNLASGQYFGLNRVGTRIWQLLTEGQTPAGIVDTIAVEFDAPRAEIERDTHALLAALSENGLIGPPL